MNMIIAMTNVNLKVFADTLQDNYEADAEWKHKIKPFSYSQWLNIYNALMNIRFREDYIYKIIVQSVKNRNEHN